MADGDDCCPLFGQSLYERPASNVGDLFSVSVGYWTLIGMTSLLYSVKYPVHGALADGEAPRQLRRSDSLLAPHLQYLVVPLCLALPLKPVPIAGGIGIVLANGQRAPQARRRRLAAVVVIGEVFWTHVHGGDTFSATHSMAEAILSRSPMNVNPSACACWIACRR